MKHAINSQGKKKKLPQGKQAKFTVGGGVVIPSQVQGYPGYDIRVGLSQEEQEDLWVTGYYMTQWRNKIRK